MSINSIIITSDNATIYTGGKSYNINSDHPSFNTIVEYAKKQEWDKIPELVSIRNTIKKKIKDAKRDDMIIDGDVIVFKDIRLPADLSTYVINIIRDHGDIKPMVQFMEKLVKNPDKRIIEQLFGFITYGKNPLTADGNFLAYKRVNQNYTSVHDSRTVNKVGSTISMDRARCNSNPNETCSTGLHFCSREYLGNFCGNKILVVEINPMNVVSIPTDYNNTKGRACSYKIIGELSEKDLVQVATKDVLSTSTVDLKFSKKKSKKKKISDKVTSIDIGEYNRGYRDGRSKKTLGMYDTEIYRQGYMDGKGHKVKRYK